jgi:N-acetylmuramoyl-L-alanine amidase
VTIIWRGNEHTNKSSRNGWFPLAIVNHVVAGSATSCDNWFRSLNNKVSSAHFCVAADGTIRQYVKLEDMAWANGLTTQAIGQARAALVRRLNVNPNLYTVSIEHEGHDGTLTEKQFEATVWLHRYIRDEVKRIWSYEIPFNRSHVLGHHEIDPVRKPNCPGRHFPWQRLISSLGEESGLSPGRALNAEDADKIIAFLSAGWFVVEQHPEARDEFNRLANALRRASGQL